MFKSFPLNRMSLNEAKNKQFHLIECITKEFQGSEILSQGDLGLVPELNRPVFTEKVEKVIANFFSAEKSMLVRGAGTAAIRLAMHSISKVGDCVLVHDAMIYPTTSTTFDMLGFHTIKVDFNNLENLTKALEVNDISCVLIQVSRQNQYATYDALEIIQLIKSKNENIKIVTDDNYTVLKSLKIGSELGADLSTFSTFKLLGPEGIGCILGKSKLIDKLQQENYSGGSQVQGHEALEVLRGMIYSPVSFAISADVCDEVEERLNKREVRGVKSAQVLNAQSRVVLVELKSPIAKEVIEQAEKLGAACYPVGAESKYEFVPLFYKISKTFGERDKNLQDRFIRINPMRAGADTIIEILNKSIGREN